MRFINTSVYVFVFLVIFTFSANIFSLNPPNRNFILVYVNYNLFKIECIIALTFVLTYIFKFFTKKWLNKIIARYQENKERRQPCENKKKKGTPACPIIEENSSVLTLGQAKLLLREHNAENNKFSIKVAIISGAAAFLLGKLADKIFLFFIIFLF